MSDDKDISAIAQDIEEREHRLDEFFQTVITMEETRGNSASSFLKRQNTFEQAMEQFMDAVMSRNKDGVKIAASEVSRISRSLVSETESAIESETREMVEAMENGADEQKVSPYFKRLQKMHRKMANIESENPDLDGDFVAQFQKISRAYTRYKRALKDNNRSEMSKAVESISGIESEFIGLIENALEDDLVRLEGDLRKISQLM